MFDTVTTYTTKDITRNNRPISCASDYSPRVTYEHYQNTQNREIVNLPTMSGKAGAYGTQGGGDTDFRKTWDRDEMAKKARERETKERDEAKERYEAKAAGKSYRRRASTPEDLKQTEARSERIDWSKMIGKQTLTSAAAGVGKRGKGAGAYCQACDLTFK
jgi:U4/U6.U5 tri-snRNP component SNU23